MQIFLVQEMGQSHEGVYNNIAHHFHFNNLQPFPTSTSINLGRDSRLFPDVYDLFPTCSGSMGRNNKVILQQNKTLR